MFCVFLFHHLFCLFSLKRGELPHPSLNFQFRQRDFQSGQTDIRQNDQLLKEYLLSKLTIQMFDQNYPSSTPKYFISLLENMS